ncbi:MAG TPA: aromatic acid exporter family protein [Acholeplasmataceae bacterium]|nr:aromatic acid exporter family protein [Acholeplasmataceae bacterium]
MIKQVLHISLKMTLAGIIALFIAYVLGIEYYTTAAAIAVLSIQWTKTDFIIIAIKRLISGVFAILLATLLFIVLNNSFIVFAVFLIIFTVISWLFKIQEGIVPSVVIVTHFMLVPQITASFVLEETLLLLIAVGTAFIVNMIYPQYSFKKVRYDLKRVDKIIAYELNNIVLNLEKNEKNVSILESKENFKKIMLEAEMVDRDVLIKNDHRYITYLYMRNTQLETLELINKHLGLIKNDHPYKDIVAKFLKKLSQNIDFDDRASNLKLELESLRKYFIETELPKSREEFEVRAMLFQILNELELFLQLKIDFHNQYPTFNQ